MGIEGSRLLYEKACSQDKTLREYDGVLHDLLHEPEKDKIIEDIMKWISMHMPNGTRISIEP